MTPVQTKYEHCCFISYKHPANGYEGHFYYEFVKALEEKLKQFLTTSLLPYHDDQVWSQPGVAYPKELSRKLCKSVCLVAVLTPDYTDSNWCRGEWEAMEKFEEDRLGKGKKGLIIPIVLRGTLEEWKKFVGERTPVELRIIKPKDQLDTVRNRTKIETMAAVISQLSSKLADPCKDCDGFQIALGFEQQAASPMLQDPDPLSR